MQRSALCAKVSLTACARTCLDPTGVQHNYMDVVLVIVGVLPVFPDINEGAFPTLCARTCPFSHAYCGHFTCLFYTSTSVQGSGLCAKACPTPCVRNCPDPKGVQHNYKDCVMIIVRVLPVFSDVNECAEQRSVCKGIPNSMCQNLPGSYRCACCAGYDPVKSGSEVVSCARNTDREFITL